MRTFSCLLISVFLFIVRMPVYGQTEMDTLGLTGTMGDTVVANRLYLESKSFTSQRNYAQALNNLNAARLIFLSTVGEVSASHAKILHETALVFQEQQKIDTAIFLYQKAIDIRTIIFGHDHLDNAKSYNNLGNCMNAKGQYEQSVEYHREALRIRLLKLELNPLDVAQSYGNLGACLSFVGRYQEAIECHRKSLNINIEKLGILNNSVANGYGNLGVCLRYIGEYDAANEYYQKALDISLQVNGVNHSFTARTYNNIGECLADKSLYNEAIKNIKKGLEIKLKILSPNSRDIAFSYSALGVCYYKKEDYGKAILYHQKVLDFLLKNLGNTHPNLSIPYQNLGNCFQKIGEFDKAIVFFQKAIAISKTTKGGENPELAGYYNGIGASLNSMGKDSEAIEYHQKALAIRIKTLGLEHPSLAKSYNNLGLCYNSLREYQHALESFNKALDILIKINPYNVELSSTFLYIGNCYYKMGEYNIAKNYFDKALNAIAYDKNNLDGTLSLEWARTTLQAVSLSQFTQYKIHRGDLLYLNTLNSTYKALHDLINYQFNSFVNTDSKQFISDKTLPIYEGNIGADITFYVDTRDQNYLKEAFTCSESSKSLLLREAMQEDEAVIFSGIPDSLLQHEHSLRIDLTWREKQRQALLDNGLSETDTNTLRISSIIFDLKNDYENLKKRLETDYPDYYRLQYDLSTVSLHYLQDTLLQNKQALLEYFVGDSSIYLFVVRPDTMIVREVKRDFPLDEWIEQFRQGFYGYYTTDEAKRTDALYEASLEQYLEYAPKLYQKLFAPITAWLPAQDSIIIVPDGALGYIPFDALLTEAPKEVNNFKSYPYLLHQYQFSYSYSATLLREMRDKQHRHEPSKSFAAFAPFYTGDTLILTDPSFSFITRKGFDPLPYTTQEVNRLHQIWGGDVVAGNYATERRFVDLASEYRVLHLATHGVADNRLGDYAYLAFTEINDSIENELLYVKDLYNLELNADLVVLSACETGVGKIQRGEGIISLARAFAYAGAKSIVTTLWSVNDKSTSELMARFYTELKAGKTKDQALRDARQTYLKSASVSNSHPFFWAAFVPVGDMRAVKQ